jgi:hypothetical protein
MAVLSMLSRLAALAALLLAQLPCCSRSSPPQGPHLSLPPPQSLPPSSSAG